MSNVRQICVFDDLSNIDSFTKIVMELGIGMDTL